MDKKIIMGSLAGGVLGFVLGYLVWGMLMNGFYLENTNQCMSLPMEDMVWWSAVAFNLIWGVFIAVVLSWAGAYTFQDGLVKGATIGLLVSLALDLSFYSFSTMFTGGLTAIAVDVVVNTVFMGLLGGVVAMVMGKVSA